MTLQRVRMLPILAIHLILCIFISESLPMEKLNASSQIVANHQERNLPSNRTYNRSDWSMVQTTQCTDEFCNGIFSKSENGNASLALQAVRIRRDFGESENGNSFPALQAVRIRRDFGELENGNSAPALQAVRIRRDFGELENGNSIPALQAVRIRRDFGELGNGNASPGLQAVRIRRDFGESRNGSSPLQAVRIRRDFDFGELGNGNASPVLQAVRIRRDFGESESGNSPALQAVRIRRDFGESESGNPSSGLQAVRIRRGSKPETIDNYFPTDSWTSCRVPDGLRTAEVRCKMWPSSIKCISYCVYGYTYDEGIQRVNTCKYKENRWSRDFDECMPFIDCRLKIVSPGTMRCRRNEVMAQPKCDVSCEIYEDKDPVKEQTFSCHASGKWSPALPFCAQPRGDTRLAKAPAVIEHKSLNYP